MIDQTTVTALAIKAGVIDSVDMESIHISKEYINDLTKFAELVQQMTIHKPLTDREITSLMVNHDFDSSWRHRISNLVKAIELTHGIGEA